MIEKHLNNLLVMVMNIWSVASKHKPWSVSMVYKDKPWSVAQTKSHELDEILMNEAKPENIFAKAPIEFVGVTLAREDDQFQAHKSRGQQNQDQNEMLRILKPSLLSLHNKIYLNRLMFLVRRSESE